MIPSTACREVGVGDVLGLELLQSILVNPQRRFLLCPLTCSTAYLLQPNQETFHYADVETTRFPTWGGRNDGLQKDFLLESDMILSLC